MPQFLSLGGPGVLAIFSSPELRFGSLRSRGGLLCYTRGLPCARFWLGTSSISTS